MEFDPARILADYENRVMHGLTAACIELSNEAKRVLSVPAPRVTLTDRTGATYYVAGWVKGGPGVTKIRGVTSYKKDKLLGGLKRIKVFYEPSPATPWDPPRKLSGRGRASITYEMDKASLSGRVGTNVPYMRGHEHGTHPWMSVAVANILPKLSGLIVDGMAVP